MRENKHSVAWVRERNIPTEPTFADRGCHVVSVTDPYGRTLGFLDRSLFFFFQVAPQLYSRSWVDPVEEINKGKNWNWYNEKKKQKLWKRNRRIKNERMRKQEWQNEQIMPDYWKWPLGVACSRQCTPRGLSSVLPVAANQETADCSYRRNTWLCDVSAFLLVLWSVLPLFPVISWVPWGNAGCRNKRKSVHGGTWDLLRLIENRTL
jgi:hypothetical protein